MKTKTPSRYDKGIFFILRMSGKHWPMRDTRQVSGWQLTRMLAHQYDKQPWEVAREVIERAELLEEGDPYDYQRQRQHDPAA